MNLTFILLLPAVYNRESVRIVNVDDVLVMIKILKFILRVIHAALVSEQEE